MTLFNIEETILQGSCKRKVELNHILGYDHICIIFFYFTGKIYYMLYLQQNCICTVRKSVTMLFTDITADTIILIQEFIIL